MDIVVGIQEKFANEQFEFSRHALDRTLLRGISVEEIREFKQYFIRNHTVAQGKSAAS